MWLGAKCRQLWTKICHQWAQVRLSLHQWEQKRLIFRQSEHLRLFIYQLEHQGSKWYLSLSQRWQQVTPWFVHQWQKVIPWFFH